MAFKTFTNQFNKGWNQDVDPRFQTGATYRDPKNISVTSDGDFFSCHNLIGSKELEEFGPSALNSVDVNILGAFECIGTYSSYGGSEKNHSIIFFVKNLNPSSLGGEVDQIILYDIVRDQLHYLLSTGPDEVESLNFPLDGTIDAVVFGENNLDKIYWDDHENVLRSIDVTDSPILNNKLVTAIPYAPIDPISYLNQENGSGQLASGSYQFSYRYFHTETKKYTTWSLFTNSIPVYPLGFEDVDRLGEIYGGVANEVTKKSIIVSIDRNDDNSDIYNSVQLAVLKHTSGLTTPQEIAYLTAPNTDWYDDSDRIIYDGGGLEEVTDIGNITIDTACVESAKTLITKDNVLFRGNIKYRDLDVSNVEFEAATTIKKQLGLSSEVYSPYSANSNNPAFVGEGRSRSAAGPLKQVNEVSEEEANSRILRIYNKDICGSCSTSVQLPEVLFGGAIVFGESDTNVRLTIGEDIQVGNKFSFNIIGYPDGMQNAIPGWLFRADYYLDSLNFFDLPLVGDIVEYASQIIGDVDSDEIVSEYTYIVQDGDTPESIASNIANEINSNIDTSIFEMTPDGSDIILKNKYPEIIRTFFNRAGVVDVEFWTSLGVNTGTTNSDNELDSLINDESSVDGGYKNPSNAVNFKGYFRDEVYRFGIVWQDKFGCWSRPVQFDFSSCVARTVLSYGNNYSIFEKDFLPKTAKVKLSVSGIEVGDYIGVQMGDGGDNLEILYFLVNGVLSDGSLTFSWSDIAFNQLDDLKSAFDTGAVSFAVTKGAEYSHVDSGVDWKFPSRENGMFPMMSAFDDETQEEIETKGFLQPIGLHISGIGGHPEWARSFAIVRVRRLKNIVWQTPHITSIVAMPSIYRDSDIFCEDPTAGGDPIGAFGPKVFSKGTARSLERDSSSTTISNSTRSRIQVDDFGNVPPISICVPPEYMMEQDDINFDTAITPAGAVLRIVDAVTVFRTETFDVDGTGARDGGEDTDRLAMGIRADSPYNHYYRDHGFTVNPPESIRYSFKSEIFDTPDVMPPNGSTRVLDYGEVVNRGAQYTFPTQPLSTKLALKRIDKYGLEPVSFQNCSSDIITQKAIVSLLNDKLGDISLYSRGLNVPADQYSVSLLNFGIGVYGTDRLNCGASCFDLDYRGEIVDLDGASSALPIVNLTRELSDDRYGTIKDVHQYIFTGSYVRLNEANTYDVDVWGGDCFITKHDIKVSNSTLETYERVPDGPNNQYGVFAYDDYQEILSVYLESRVNADLQANPFIYPVRDTKTLSEFSTDYEYPYNFSYSIENEAKVWTSKSELEENRLEYPARIIYSDEKVFQSDIEGFDSFQALSFYDLPEDFGGITKLTKLSNGNVYSIQDSGVSILPINKNVIEDATGGQIVINSGTLINTPQYILTENGSQHIRSVQNSESQIFFMDALKREIFKIGGGSDGKVSENGVYSVFLSDLDNNRGIPDRKVVSGYDFNNNEYWIGVNEYTDTLYENNSPSYESKQRWIHIWSDKINAWRTELAPSDDTEIMYMRFSKSDTYIFGKKADNSYVIESMYRGDTTGLLLGEVVPSEISVVINAEEQWGKTFDVIRIDANNRVDNLELTVQKEDGTLDQITLMDAAVRPRHDGYEFPVLRDSNNARLRGKYAIARITMNNGDDRDVKISSLTTKYRLSSRVFR